MLKVSKSDSFPGARYVAGDPILESEFCKAQSVQLIAGVCDAGGYPYTIRMGKIFVDMSEADFLDESQGEEPAPTGINMEPMVVGVGNFATGTLFGTEDGRVWVSDNAVWGAEVVLVEQTMTSWGVAQVDFDPVRGGLPQHPTPVYVYIENACGRVNLAGLASTIEDAP